MNSHREIIYNAMIKKAEEFFLKDWDPVANIYNQPEVKSGQIKFKSEGDDE